MICPPPLLSSIQIQITQQLSSGVTPQLDWYCCSISRWKQLTSLAGSLRRALSLLPKVVEMRGSPKKTVLTYWKRSARSWKTPNKSNSKKNSAQEETPSRVCYEINFSYMQMNLSEWKMCLYSAKLGRNVGLEEGINHNQTKCTITIRLLFNSHSRPQICGSACTAQHKQHFKQLCKHSSRN